jgi:hypothetical protein
MPGQECIHIHRTLFCPIIPVQILREYPQDDFDVNPGNPPNPVNHGSNLLNLDLQDLKMAIIFYFIHHPNASCTNDENNSSDLFKDSVT